MQQRVRVRGRMKLTIDNLNGAGERITARCSIGAPPKIVRKLNQPAVLTAWLACRERTSRPRREARCVSIATREGCGSADIWTEAPLLEFAGEAMGKPVFRAALNAKGEIAALDRRALSEHAAMGGYTAGQAVTALTLRGERCDTMSRPCRRLPAPEALRLKPASSGAQPQAQSQTAHAPP